MSAVRDLTDAIPVGSYLLQYYLRGCWKGWLVWRDGKIVARLPE